MPVTVIGIDPGKKGGYAILRDGAYEAHPWDDEAFVKDL